MCHFSVYRNSRNSLLVLLNGLNLLLPARAIHQNPIICKISQEQKWESTLLWSLLSCHSMELSWVGFTRKYPLFFFFSYLKYLYLLSQLIKPDWARILSLARAGIDTHNECSLKNGVSTNTRINIIGFSAFQSSRWKRGLTTLAFHRRLPPFWVAEVSASKRASSV